MRIINIKSAFVAAMLAVGALVATPIVGPAPAQASIFKKIGRAVSKTVKGAERTAGHVVKDVGKAAGGAAKGVGRAAGGAAKGVGKAAGTVARTAIRLPVNAAKAVVRTTDKVVVPIANVGYNTPVQGITYLPVKAYGAVTSPVRGPNGAVRR